MFKKDDSKGLFWVKGPDKWKSPEMQITHEDKKTFIDPS